MIDGLPIVRPANALAWLYRKEPRLYSRIAGAQPDHVNGFYVAHLASVAQVEAVKNALASALEDGRSFKHWRDGLKRDGIDLPHATTVWRTNLFNSFNNGRYQVFADDASEFPYLMYEAVDDEKTRPNHAANDGLTMRLDNDRWDGRIPPLGFNCRCLLVNLTEQEASTRAKLTTPRADGEPDSPEWGINPFGGRRPSIAHVVDPNDIPPDVQRMVTDYISAAQRRARQEEVDAVPANAIALGAAIREPAFTNVDDLAKGALADYMQGNQQRADRFVQTYNTDPLKVNPVDAAYVSLLRDALTDSLPIATLPVGRVLSLATPNTSRAAEALATLAVGDVLALTGATEFAIVQANATTAQRSVTLVVESILRTGSSARDVSAFAAGDAVLMWGARFRVERIDDANGSATIYLREVADNTDADVTLADRKRVLLGWQDERSLPIDDYLDAENDWHI